MSETLACYMWISQTLLTLLKENIDSLCRTGTWRQSSQYRGYCSYWGAVGQENDSTVLFPVSLCILCGEISLLLSFQSHPLTPMSDDAISCFSVKFHLFLHHFTSCLLLSCQFLPAHFLIYYKIPESIHFLSSLFYVLSGITSQVHCVIRHSG